VDLQGNFPPLSLVSSGKRKEGFIVSLYEPNHTSDRGIPCLRIEKVLLTAAEGIDMTSYMNTPVVDVVGCMALC
jgi:hypothetical protein